MKKIATFIVIMTLISCKNVELIHSYIQFNNPQPENVDAISQFPKKYRGSYGLDASNQIVIKPQYIFLKQEQNNAFSRSAFDSIAGYEIRNDKVYDTDRSICLKSEIRNDSVFIHHTQIDTLFSFASGEVAKEYKSSLILNKEIEGKYMVQFIQFGTVIKRIQLGTLKDANLIQHEIGIKQQTAMNGSDTLHVILHPTRADFRKILRLDGFEYESIYYFK